MTWHLDQRRIHSSPLERPSVDSATKEKEKDVRHNEFAYVWIAASCEEFWWRRINETILSRTYKRRVAFEHYLSKSRDRFYRPGYNLLCSNIGGRHSICHSVRAPLC